MSFFIYPILKNVGVDLRAWIDFIYKINEIKITFSRKMKFVKSKYQIISNFQKFYKSIKSSLIKSRVKFQ